MRKLFCLVALMFVGMLASCQTMVVIGDAITLQWDPSVLTGISYEVVMESYPASGLIQVIATTTALEQLVVFSTEGRFHLGVRAIRTVDGVTLYSDYSWSDVEGAPQPWYVAYYQAPQRIERIRIK